MTPNRRLHTLTRIALVTALLVVLGLVPGLPLGLIPVPIVLQNLGVMLAGGLLRPGGAMGAVGLLLLLVAVGLPVLTGGSGGAAVFVGPTGGYLWGWLLGAGLIARLRRQVKPVWWQEYLATVLGGVLVADLAGSLWLAHQAHLALSTALLANLAFLPGDLIKAALATTIARRVRRVRHLD